MGMSVLLADAATGRNRSAPFRRSRGRRRGANRLRGSAALVALLVGCTSGPSGPAVPPVAESSGSAAPACPVPAVRVVVSVDQWGDIVGALAGRCGDVTTIIAGSSVDPHDYEPTPGDTAAFGRAQLVVRNGLGYDTWAEKAVQSLSAEPVIVDAGDVVGRKDGDNAHVWYEPAGVEKVAAAVSRELTALAPEAARYFAERAAGWTLAMQPYRAAVADVARLASGKAYAATEPVFDDMAAAVGLRDLTPDGYRAAIANGSEPSPGDVLALQDALRGGRVDVLVLNSQTEGALSGQIRDTAADASVPVVAVTETMPPGSGSFVQWQVAQLRSLQRELS